MALLIALLMAIAAIAFPVAIDIARHRRDNILARTVSDVAEWSPIAAFRSLIREFFSNAIRLLKLAASLSVLAVLAYEAVKYLIAHL